MRRYIALTVMFAALVAALGCQHIGGKCDCGFNPNDYSAADPDTRRNRAIVDRFEPGSVMKVFTIADALANKSVQPNASIYCEEGTMQIDNVTSDDNPRTGRLTALAVIAIIAASALACSLPLAVHVTARGVRVRVARLAVSAVHRHPRRLPAGPAGASGRGQLPAEVRPDRAGVGESIGP